MNPRCFILILLVGLIATLSVAVQFPFHNNNNDLIIKLSSTSSSSTIDTLRQLAHDYDCGFTPSHADHFLIRCPTSIAHMKNDDKENSVIESIKRKISVSLKRSAEILSFAKPEKTTEICSNNHNDDDDSCCFSGPRTL